MAVEETFEYGYRGDRLEKLVALVMVVVELTSFEVVEPSPFRSDASASCRLDLKKSGSS